MDNAETWEARLEDRLNQTPPSHAFSTYEILNFSVGGYSTLHRLRLLERRVGAFSPDLVLIPLYDNEDSRLLTHLVSLVAAGIPIPYPSVRRLVRRSGATAGMVRPAIRQRLGPFVNELISWSLRQIAQRAAVQGLPVLTVIVPRTDGRRRRNWQRIQELARAAGLEPVVLEGIYAGQRGSAIQLRPWDEHPNARGHRLIANAVYGVLRGRGPELFVPVGTLGRAASPTLVTTR